MRKSKGQAMLLFVLLLMSPVFPTLGYEVIIQRHSQSYPRVGNPILTVLPNGSILSVFTVMIGEHMGIYGKLSGDLRVWSEPFLIKGQTVAFQPFSCALFTLGNKTFLIYDRYVWFSDTMVNNNCSIWILESANSGETWNNDRRIDLDNFDYTIASYSVCITENGTLILPISHSIGPGVWQSAVLRSDNEGLSWFEGQAIPNLSKSVTGLDEASIVQLSNGSLFALIRTYSVNEPYHACSLSNDLGLTWSEPSFVSEMTSLETTPALLKAGVDCFVAAWINRTSAVDSEGLDAVRSPLMIAISWDDCSSWQNILVVEDTKTLNMNVSMNDLSLVMVEEKIVLCFRRYHQTSNKEDLNDDAVMRVYEVNESGLNEIMLFPDFNHDGKLDILDAILLSNNVNTSNALTDLNYDGLTNLDDALLFAQAF